MNISEFLSSPATEYPFVSVLGHPVVHSRSPTIHNAALEYHKLPVTYHALDCPSDNKRFLPELFLLPGFRGANVTIPLKQDIIAFLDKLDESSQEIGAVNTIVPEGASERKLVGFNTDAYGFFKPLEDTEDLTTATILGGGGASRAVIYTLRRMGVRTLYLASRRAGRTQIKIPDDVRIVDYSIMGKVISESDIIVNTTPVGMYPDTGKMPIDEKLLPLLQGKICYDIIYNPIETRFLREARLYGAKTIGGLDMFIYQAAKSFELWFGKPMPVELVRNIITSDLKY